MSLSQSLGNWGNLYLSGQTYNYWEKRGTNTQYQIAYSNSFHILNYSVNLSQSIDKETGKRDNSIYLSLSLPLGDNHSADSGYSRSGNDINQRLGVNGSLANVINGVMALTLHVIIKAIAVMTQILHITIALVVTVLLIHVIASKIAPPH